MIKLKNVQCVRSQKFRNVAPKISTIDKEFFKRAPASSAKIHSERILVIRTWIGPCPWFSTYFLDPRCRQTWQMFGWLSCVEGITPLTHGNHQIVWLNSTATCVSKLSELNNVQRVAFHYFCSKPDPILSIFLPQKVGHFYT